MISDRTLYWLGWTLAALSNGLSAAPTTSEIFTDRAAEVGLEFTHFNGMSGKFYFSEIMGPGGALFDYDNDGDLDVYLVQGAKLGDMTDYGDAIYPAAGLLPPGDSLFRNDLVETGNLNFVDVTEASGIVARGYGMGVAVGDFTGDGYSDLYITNFGSNQMLRNNGGGTFTDVTDIAGTDDGRWSTSAAFFDYDRDGWLDLFVGNYVNFTLASHKPCYAPSGAVDYCSPLSYQPDANRLFRNRGDGTFADVSSAARISGAYGGALGVIAADFDGDSWPDVYVANDGRPNQLWINQRDGRFVDDALLSGTAFNEQGAAEASMGVDVADFDGDGDDDLFVTHLDRETNTLYRNDGTGLFEDDTVETGLGLPSRGFTGFGTAWLDYDSDGRLDLLVANGAVRIINALVATGDSLPLRQTNQLLRQLENGRFQEVTAMAGSAFELSEVSRGTAVGDVDNDGDTDVLILNNNGPVRLLINNGAPSAAWLGLRLVDYAGGGDSYGTRVGCTLDDGRTVWRTVRAAASYCSSNDPRVLFGLGAASSVRLVEARWPDGKREQWEESAVHPINRYHTLKRGSGRSLP